MATLIFHDNLIWSLANNRGGHAMSNLQWLHGLERLGHRILFIDYLEDYSQPAISTFQRIICEWWHPDQCALILTRSTESLYGLSTGQVRRFAAEADALITLNVPCNREPLPLLEQVRPRILVDRDPGFTQLWVTETGQDATDIYGEQDLYFTFGGNIGSPRCSVSTLGICWLPTYNPVILNWWLPREEITHNRFTTVAGWWEGGYYLLEGRVVGPKSEQWRKFIDLPKRIGESVEIALEIEPDDPDISYLQDHGWRVQSPKVVGSPALYRDYVCASAGEFSCAKGVYVETQCGWFSDRSACYLAAGRPVVVQATGFERLLPTGKGLFAVTTVEEAAEAIKAIRRDYGTHSAAARAIAAEYFDSDKLLSRLLAEADIRSASSSGRTSS